MNSRAIQDRDVMEENFPDQSGYNYYPFSKNRLTPEMDVIFRSREPMTIFNADVLAELKVKNRKYCQFSHDVHMRESNVFFFFFF